MTNLNYKVDIPKNLDLVITGGGAVGGAYGLGVLKMIKELEKKNIVIINSISASSIGSILGAHYLNDSLDEFEKIFNKICNKIKEKKNLNVELKKIFKKKYNKFNLERVNNKLFIKYIKNNKYCIKNEFSDIEELIKEIYNSCSIPYFFEDNIFNKNYCCDAILPPLLIENVNNNYNKLFIPLKLNKIFKRNFNNNTNNLMDKGYNDCKLFFLCKNNNNILLNLNHLSYLSDWNIFDFITYRILEFTIILFIFIFKKLSLVLPTSAINIVKIFWLDFIIYKSFM